MMAHTIDFLPTQGLYPIVNHIFSRQGNRFDWLSLGQNHGSSDIVALGNSAIGYLNGCAYRNISPIGAYMAWNGTPRLPVRQLHAVTPEERSVKTMLRFCRFLHTQKDQLDATVLDAMRPVIDDLIGRGVIGENSQALWVTRMGHIWFDNVFLSFVPPAQEPRMWKIMY
jgi:coproporphyrinogen III oxidase-like Fe-S oxidoreductase